MASRLTIDEFKQKLESDPELKAELSARIASVLRDMGVDDSDVANLIPPPQEPSHLVFVSRTDSKRNSRSFIIG